MKERKNKDKVVAFRLSSEDFADFENKLSASRMSRSEFFREVFINANVQLTVKAAPSKDHESLLYLYNKASNNLNQLAHQVNSAHVSGHVSPSLYLKYLNALVEVRDLLLSGVRYVD